MTSVAQQAPTRSFKLPDGPITTKDLGKLFDAIKKKYYGLEYLKMEASLHRVIGNMWACRKQEDATNEAKSDESKETKQDLEERARREYKFFPFSMVEYALHEFRTIIGPRLGGIIPNYEGITGLQWFQEIADSINAQLKAKDYLYRNGEICYNIIPRINPTRDVTIVPAILAVYFYFRKYNPNAVDRVVKYIVESKKPFLEAYTESFHNAALTFIPFAVLGPLAYRNKSPKRSSVKDFGKRGRSIQR